MCLFKKDGISCICRRHKKINDKDMKNHDPTKPSKYITYLDEHNLYGWEMSGYFPYGGFKWLENVDKSIRENSSIGYKIIIHEL